MYLGPGTIFDSRYGQFSNQENHNLIDLRPNELKMDQYSIKGQVKFQMIMDYTANVIKAADQSAIFFQFGKEMKINPKFNHKGVKILIK